MGSLSEREEVTLLGAETVMSTSVIGIFIKMLTWEIKLDFMHVSE